MTDTHVLVEIVVVLLAAKVAAEVAERLRVPAVVGEILAGIVVGPSLLGWVDSGEVLTTLGEIGVILLLVEVGMEMDVAGLRAVGRVATSVGLVGVAVPLVLGLGVGGLFGLSGIEALFVGAALTATSVGISARVFGDLRALARVEARTVLGAAVVDDILGLVILTVVVRLAESGSVSLPDVASVTGVALVFLVGAGLVALRLAPPLFDAISRSARSGGTLVAGAFAFALAVSVLAAEARLAPIIGAFVAGLALGRSNAATRVHRELTPISHLLVPVFFLNIGVHADIGRFASPEVLAVAGALCAVAVVGKVASALAMGRTSGDRLLVGLGMIPRGEVGLIFATIGLEQGVLDQDLYAAVLVVVLVTTLMTPFVLRARLHALRADAGGTSEDAGEDLLVRALAAASTIGREGPAPALIEELGRTTGDLTWSPEARTRFRSVLVDGGPGAWRFLHLTSVLARSLPELDDIVRRRAGDPAELDPLGVWRWPRLERLGRGDGGPAECPMSLMLAALALDATEDDTDDATAALLERVGARVGLDPSEVAAAVAMAADSRLLESVCARPWALQEEALTVLAEHLGTLDRLDAVAELVRAAPSVADDDLASVTEAVVQAVRDVLVGVEGAGVRTAAQRRQAAAARLDPDSALAVDEAPRAHVCTQTVDNLARQAELVASCRRSEGRAHAAVTEDVPRRYRVEVAAPDRIGLLATQARVLSVSGYDIESASTATWPDGTAVAAFVVTGPAPPPADLLVSAGTASTESTQVLVALPDSVIDFDDRVLPWHTLCTVEAPDEPGLLAAVAAAVTAVGLSIHSAHLSGANGRVHDEFELTGRSGGKLSTRERDELSAALRLGVTPRPGWRRRRGAMAVS